ncbi:MAG: polysaccharide export protein [Candidatus Aminicenantes bacterium]|nr:polysaccharide export protein [Candidatus Aminicenantes bacterium]
MRKIAIPVIVTICLCAFALSVPPVFGREGQEVLGGGYRIGARDLLEIRVFGQDKLNSTVRVTEQGKITFPYLGEVPVEGLTASELERRLVQLLEKNLYRNPEVSVRILEFQSKQVSVLGAVAKQGFIELIGRQTLLQVITAAGGLMRDAGKEIIVFRQQPDGTSSPLRIVVDDLMQKGDPTSNIVIEPGDTVMVQVDKSVPIYISGEIKNPGVLQVLKSRIPTLTQAIIQAGGFTEQARKGKVIVTRREDRGNTKKFEIDVTRIQSGKDKDFQLEENDAVFVSKTWF